MQSKGLKWALVASFTVHVIALLTIPVGGRLAAARQQLTQRIVASHVRFARLPTPPPEPTVKPEPPPTRVVQRHRTQRLVTRHSAPRVHEPERKSTEPPKAAEPDQIASRPSVELTPPQPAAAEPPPTPEPPAAETKAPEEAGPAPIAQADQPRAAELPAAQALRTPHAPDDSSTESPGEAAAAAPLLARSAPMPGATEPAAGTPAPAPTGPAGGGPSDRPAALAVGTAPGPVGFPGLPVGLSSSGGLPGSLPGQGPGPGGGSPGPGLTRTVSTNLPGPPTAGSPAGGARTVALGTDHSSGRDAGPVGVGGGQAGPGGGLATLPGNGGTGGWLGALDKLVGEGPGGGGGPGGQGRGGFAAMTGPSGNGAMIGSGSGTGRGAGLGTPGAGGRGGGTAGGSGGQGGPVAFASPTGTGIGGGGGTGFALPGSVGTGTGLGTGAGFGDGPGGGGGGTGALGTKGGPLLIALGGPTAGGLPGVGTGVGAGTGGGMGGGTGLGGGLGTGGPVGVLGGIGSGSGPGLPGLPLGTSTLGLGETSEPGPGGLASGLGSPTSASQHGPGGLYVGITGSFDIPMGVTNSDYVADPHSMPNLLGEIRNRTNVHVTISDRTVPLKLEAIKDLPVLHLRGHRPFTFTPEEREALRQYVAQGGTVFGEDSHGPFGECFRREMKIIFGQGLRDLPQDHDLYRAHYVLKSVPAGDMGERYPLQGIDLRGRLSVIFSRNDYGGCWDGTGGWVKPESREPAFEMGTNLFVYIVAHWNKRK